MGTPLKVSDSLFAVARQEAQAASRSITAQVEHWARIGRAVEALVAHRELLTLKKAGELLTPVFPSAARRREVQDLIMRVTASTDREAVIAEIHAAGKPVYAADRHHPGLVVEVAPDGTRRVGRLEGRRFLPAEDGSAGRAR
jgi:hypothetical protein